MVWQPDSARIISRQAQAPNTQSDRAPIFMNLTMLAATDGALYPFCISLAQVSRQVDGAIEKTSFWPALSESSTK